jgi:hypothetical protein
MGGSRTETKELDEFKKPKECKTNPALSQSISSISLHASLSTRVPNPTISMFDGALKDTYLISLPLVGTPPQMGLCY